MAKEQSLSLNPIKISGICGRLMCCLKFEDDIYTQEKKRFPKVGSKVIYEDKQYKVTSINVLSDTIKIEGEGTVLFVDLKDVKREFKNETKR